eukprot:gene6849-9516_t
MEHEIKRAKVTVSPSPVVHIRSLPPHTTPQEIHAALEPFGAIMNVSLIPNRAQGLAEFSDVQTASSCVYSSQEARFDIFRFWNFIFKVDSSHPYNVPGKVLLMTIINASYPINVDVIYAVCSPIARVLRIVMIRKNGIQAIVEFPDVNSATTVMNSLQGANIYQGCCTLRIEYSKVFNSFETWHATHSEQISCVPSQIFSFINLCNLSNAQSLIKAERVNVRYNSDEARDFTVSLPPPPVSLDYGPSHHSHGPPPHHSDHYSSYRGPPSYSSRSYSSSSPRTPVAAGWGGERRPRPCSASVVLMVYHINKGSMNCEKLFNLFCIYGNPTKIKILISKEGMAMAQFESLEQSKTILDMLDGSEVQGQRMELGYSRNQDITDTPSEVKLPNGQPAMVSFEDGKLFRFQGTQPETGMSLLRPTPIVKFYDLPEEFSRDHVMKILGLYAAPSPMEIILEKEDNGKPCGYLKYRYASQATDAIIVCNNVSIPNVSKREDGSTPIFKLCFAPEDSLDSNESAE